MMKKDDEPKVSLILLYLLLGVLVVVSAAGFALWYSDTTDIAAPRPEKPATGWGIFGDSPIRSHR